MINDNTAKPPHTHCTNSVPVYGTAESKFVITTAPQNDICPHGRTYPRKAVAIVMKKKIGLQLIMSASI
jgi:hypothetical protein